MHGVSYSACCRGYSKKSWSIQNSPTFCCHLLLQEGLGSCHSLSVLYLYSNAISRIRGLTSCSNLTHLYLQNNHISRLEGLNTLHRLSKL